jgi:hypothetical protein
MLSKIAKSLSSLLLKGSFLVSKKYIITPRAQISNDGLLSVSFPEINSGGEYDKVQALCLSPYPFLVKIPDMPKSIILSSFNEFGSVKRIF